jgi:hypothetical protein
MADLSENPVLAPSQPLPQLRPGEFSVDSSHLSTTYANFVRLTGTPEELVLDFGLNAQWTPRPGEPIQLAHRLVLNYYTAKRLLEALHWAVQQHENVYGVLETDVQKRTRQLSH